MRNELTVAVFEIRSLLSKPSFWLLTVLFPLFILGLTLGGQLMAGNAGAAAQEELEAATTDNTANVTAYVDLSGLIESLPPDVSVDTVQAYPSEAAAMSALEAGEVSEYYVIAADYVETGDITLIQREYAPLSRTHEGLLQTILGYNLVGAEANRWGRIDNPIGQIQVEQLAPPSVEAAEERATNPAMASIVPIAAVMLLFFVLVMSSGYMLRSVSREKENRTVEVLLLSLRPRELMLGKILGLSAVAMIQMGVWLTSGLLFMGRGQVLLQTATSLQLPASFVAWVIAYVLLGYLLYASLMGALGALAPNAREANQFSFAILLPLIIPVWLNSFLASAPDSLLAVTLSLFPLTAPPAMISRLAATDVPLWQPAVGIVGLAVTTYLAILLSARFFRADTLLSTSAINWRRIFQAARGSE